MKRVALVVGHKATSPGAINEATGTSEFEFNLMLAESIADALAGTDVECPIVLRRSYNELPGDINELNPDYVVSLHCNAFNTQATGVETLYYHNSTRGKAMAEILQRNVVNALKLRDRGVKPKHSEDRGGYLLRYTDAPCIIAEPFFIDNNVDFGVAIRYQLDLVDAYTSAILEIAEGV